MKKIIILSGLLFLWSCAAPLEYDHTKLLIDSDNRFSCINTTNAVRERDGQMLAQVSGISSQNQSVYYKFVWFDADGIKVSTSLTQWKKVNLRKNAEFNWNATAPSKRAITYRVYITDDIGNGIIE